MSEPIQYEERCIFSIYAFNNRTLTMSKQNLIEKIRNKQLEKGYKMFLIIARINRTKKNCRGREQSNTIRQYG